MNILCSVGTGDTTHGCVMFKTRGKQICECACTPFLMYLVYLHVGAGSSSLSADEQQWMCYGLQMDNLVAVITAMLYLSAGTATQSVRTIIYEL